MIQSSVRMGQAMKRIARIRKAKQEAKDRFRREKKEYEEKRRKEKEEKEEKRRKQVDAAILLQKRIRICNAVARADWIKTENRAAVVIQAGIRGGVLTARKVENQREVLQRRDVGLARIQSVVRGRAGRKQARNVRSEFRLRMAKVANELERMRREGAILIQKR